MKSKKNPKAKKLDVRTLRDLRDHDLMQVRGGGKPTAPIDGGPGDSSDGSKLNF